LPANSYSGVASKPAAADRGKQRRIAEKQNFRRVLGALFEDMRLDTPFPEDLSADRLTATIVANPTFFGSCPNLLY
jgi:hypothetical protein